MSRIRIPDDATPLEVAEVQDAAYQWLRENRCRVLLASVVDCDLKAGHLGPHIGRSYEAVSGARDSVRVMWGAACPPPGQAVTGQG